MKNGPYFYMGLFLKNTMKYIDQFNKLTTAYIAGMVNPCSPCACFVGNLLNNKPAWASTRELTAILSGKIIGGELLSSDTGNISDIQGKKMGFKVIEEEGEGIYTPKDILDLELCFLSTIQDNGSHLYRWEYGCELNEKDENALFLAFEKTLEMLKSIHIRNGEVIDEEPVFKRRIKTALGYMQTPPITQIY